MKWIPAALLACLLLPIHAKAGVLYRCEGPDGVANFSSKKVAGQACKVVAQYKVAKAEPMPATPKPATPSPTGNQAPAVGAVISTAASGTEQTLAQSAVSKPAEQPKFLRMGYSTTFSWVDGAGVKHFSNRRPKGVVGVQTKRIEYPIFSIPGCYACGATPGVNFGNVRLNLTAFADEIRGAAGKHGVEEAIVRAIIHAESAYRPHVVSPKNAQGLMQLIPATAKRFGVSDPFDPAQNIDGGTQYLAWLLKRYKNDLTLASAAYNAGEGAVDRYGGVPPFKETQRYVQRVAQLAQRYREKLPGG